MLWKILTSYTRPYRAEPAGRLGGAPNISGSSDLSVG